MAAPKYVPLRTILYVLSLSALWGSTVALRLLWGMIRMGPSEVFRIKPRKQRPAVLDDPQYGTHHFARLKNVRLHYVAKGQEGRPLILFLHGFPELWYSWRHQLKEFGNNFRAVAVDMRGYGESGRPQGVAEYYTDKLTGDIQELIEYLGYRKCYLVGHDWGALVAWNVAAKYPSVVEKLIICNVPNPNVFMKHIWESKTQLLKSWYMFFFQMPYFPELFMGTTDLALITVGLTSKTHGIKPSNFSVEDLEAFKYTFQKSEDRTGPINYYRAFLRYQLDKSYEQKIKAPTLIIWGTRDAFLEKEMAEASKKYVTSDCITCYIQGASHWVQQDEPETVNRYITDFLAGNNPSKI